MRVALATPNLTDGDGVGNDLLGMARCLTNDGHAVELFAESARVAREVRPLDELPTALGRGDVLIYHHSIGCEPAVRAVEATAARAVVKYHNITPPRFFHGVNPDAVAGAEQGLKQAARLAKAAAAVWVDSAFNGREFPGRDWDELPPFHQVHKLHAASPDAHTLGDLDGWGTVILCVGRAAPNKNLLLAVDAFAAFRRDFDPSARLVLAGEHVFRPYSEAIAERVRERGVEDAVVVTGRVTVGQLKALYLSADALLVTSDHEGFCVPLVEAMSLGTPVVAVPNAAVPDTGGDAVRYAPADAGELAAALREVIADGAARERHLLAGRRRYAGHFADDAIGRRFRELFGRVATA